MQRKRLFPYITGILALAIPAVLLWQRQAIFDQWRLYRYQPPAEVVELADVTTMNNDTRRLFYVYHPAVQDKATFNTHCRENEETIVLGCYVDGEGIYLLDVTDNRLAGVEEVTAAHETLHAAYARLNSRERNRVNQMLDNAFDALSSPRIKETIEIYRKRDPNIVHNELHSILGTEVRVLPTELEDYYKRYFIDRSKVVGFSEQYEQAFTARKNLIQDYDAQLAALKGEIDGLQNSLKAAEQALARDRTNLNNLRSSGDVEGYNAAVPGYNVKVATFNRDIDTLTNKINQYNEIVAKRNAVASEEEELVKAIDSREIVPKAQ